MARRILYLALEYLLAINDLHLPQVEGQLVDVDEYPVTGADLQGNVARGIRQRFEPGAVGGDWAACVALDSGLNEISGGRATDANPGRYGSCRRPLTACHRRLDERRDA